jgi:hypothetical protein
MSSTVDSQVLDASNPSSWASVSFETAFSLDQDQVEEVQREALARRFEVLRPQLVALKNLAARQGVERVETFDDVVPVLFDHRVYKSYPTSLVEQRKFDRLTAWLQRLTTHDISSISLDGVDSVSSWLGRIEETTPLSVGHTTGTSGKLSFIPRSETELLAFTASRMEFWRAQTGLDFRTAQFVKFGAGHRRAHYWLGSKLTRLHSVNEFGGAGAILPFDYELPVDLLSMAARLASVDEQGEMDKLDIDPKLLQAQAELLERNRNRDQDLERWLHTLAEDYRGQRVFIGGSPGDLLGLALKGQELGITPAVAPGSILSFGGGMKSYQNPPADWEQVLSNYFGTERSITSYGMTECLSHAPRCSAGFYHFLPYVLPILVDDDYVPLPREGVQTGRMTLFDFLAETYWGGFISGDQVTVYWDYDCPCGWKGPRIDGNIARFAQLEGAQDDKLSCAGVEKAYSEFMDYIASI